MHVMNVAEAAAAAAAAVVKQVFSGPTKLP